MKDNKSKDDSIRIDDRVTRVDGVSVPTETFANLKPIDNSKGKNK